LGEAMPQGADAALAPPSATKDNSGGRTMSINDAVLATQPTSYWPLDDPSGSPSCHDEMGLHETSAPPPGVTLSVLPFGASQAPFFDGALGSVLTIPNDPQYSQPSANALTVAAWLCPLTLDNANVVGAQDKFVHYIEKAVAEAVDAEWALRFYNRNQPNGTRHSRLSFYTFNLGSPAHEGNGSYMEYGLSKNDETPIALGQWVFAVGEAEPWTNDFSTGCALWKQGVAAKREKADKYAAYNVRPQHGSGSITVGGSQETGFKGAIAHLAIWNRLLSGDEIASIWTAGSSDLRACTMYHSFV
jgi:hypothetical protein